MNVLSRIFAIGGLAALLAPAPAHAQLQEVRQTVFGMDCAPCAYALERRVGGLDGVAEVAISLNEGQAVVRLQAGNRAALSTLREAVREAGFAPRETIVRVAGTLQEEDGRWVLMTPSGERFHIESAANDAARAALRRRDGHRIVVTGRVAAGEPSGDGWPLRSAALAS